MIEFLALLVIYYITFLGVMILTDYARVRLGERLLSKDSSGLFGSLDHFISITLLRPLWFLYNYCYDLGFKEGKNYQKRKTIKVKLSNKDNDRSRINRKGRPRKRKVFRG